MQKFANEQQMIDFGQNLAKTLEAPAVIELIGDVGAGKTTITKGIAHGLGIEDEITCPTFTLSKRYSFQYSRRKHDYYYRMGGFR